MSYEGMQPHELAAQLESTGYEIVNGRVESERLGGLLDRSQPVWRQLRGGRFDESDYGYVTFGVEDWSSDHLSSSDHVDGLLVRYKDREDVITPLGGIRRTSFVGKTATAYVTSAEGQSEPLLPSDPRWNAVVGAAERAIAQCMAEGDQ